MTGTLNIEKVKLYSLPTAHPCTKHEKGENKSLIRKHVKKNRVLGIWGKG